ncbi:DUF3488 and transglutaminase-like domain-containing protein [Massilia sp. ST3]|uniref:transglutaminase family protein n=1 Tax=Massilia sp. ST3 TaxID=2824903 RepID=UPI001B8208A2|nr:DUF3488 and transglutaminase-like domain-containing protein [Massilia sp. ST3]MBQ5948456.1 DUF3488 domain-containing transglutaminase family protein [Massilia sp. ST3]
MNADASAPPRPQRLPRDKADTILLLVSALLVLLPHARHLPPWISLLCGAILSWRAAITLRGKRMPSSLVLLPVAALSMIGVQASYQTLLGRDAGVAMLVLLVAFKMLEMHARRDLFVVIFLCFFLVLTNFFYSQSLFTALLMVLSVLALLTTQLSFQFTGAVPPLRTRLLMGARMLALAAPLALLMFVVFPRIQGPLWGASNGGAGGKSGLSDQMAPGQMSSLALSDEPVFRVRFDGRPPEQSMLYWRGPVLDAFDGLTWSRGAGRASSRDMRLSVGGPAFDYEVTLEPSSSRWVFALEMPGRVPALPGRATRVSPQFELSVDSPPSGRVRYRVRSHLDYALQRDGMDDPGRWLLLPYGFNPRALQAGLALRRESDPARRVEAVLRRFREQAYSYTLEPPLLGRHTVDEFLYRTRAGFCEHYAGAFVFLMRAAGVPSRVVTGYQGGEMNPFDGVMTVRQSDAHAWAEVWLAGRGWVRVDPTAAVAPERVRRGLSAAVQLPAPFGIEALRGLEAGGDAWFGQLRNAFGAVNNGWNQWVLNYTPERQRKVVGSLQAGLRGWPFVALLTSAGILLLLYGILVRRKAIDPIEALYSVLCKRLGQHGLARAADEGPTAYAARVAAASHLASPTRDAAAEFLRRYSAWRYAPVQADPRLAATLKSLLSQVR